MRRLGALALVAACAGVLGACQEDLAGGAACPSLCPGQQLDVQDTVLYPFLPPPETAGLLPLDTTLVGYPPIGTHTRMLLARRGDTLSTAVVARFDTLPSRFRRSASDTTTVPIAAIDTATITLEVDTTGTVAAAPVTIHLYDVPASPQEPDTAAVRAAIGAGSPVGSRTFDPESIGRTLRIRIDEALVLARAQQGGRLRLAAVVTSDSAVQLDVLSAEAGAAPVLRMLARSESDTATVAVPVQSRSPAGSGFVGNDLADYMFVVTSPTTPEPPPATLAVGGLRGSRAYLRFRIPSWLDSTTIVRATLLLTQRPNQASVSADDTIAVLPRVVIASRLVDSLVPAKAALLLGNPNLAIYALPPALTTPADSGVVRLEVANALRLWRIQDSTLVTRALVLQSAVEGYRPQELYFFSTEAAVDTLRPRLHVIYIPRARFGLP